MRKLLDIRIKTYKQMLTVLFIPWLIGGAGMLFVYGLSIFCHDCALVVFYLSLSLAMIVACIILLYFVISILFGSGVPHLAFRFGCLALSYTNLILICQVGHWVMR